MKMPFPNDTFDAVYSIEATCHAPVVSFSRSKKAWFINFWTTTPLRIIMSHFGHF